MDRSCLLESQAALHGSLVLVSLQISYRIAETEEANVPSRGGDPYPNLTSTTGLFSDDVDAGEILTSIGCAVFVSNAFPSPFWGLRIPTILQALVHSTYQFP